MSSDAELTQAFLEKHGPIERRTFALRYEDGRCHIKLGLDDPWERQLDWWFEAVSLLTCWLLERLGEHSRATGAGYEIGFPAEGSVGWVVDGPKYHEAPTLLGALIKAWAEMEDSR